MTLIFAELNDKELDYLLKPEMTGVFVLLRGYGYSLNKQLLEDAVAKTDIDTVYTNDETLLNNSVLFNNKTKRYNIYFYNKETHKNVWIHDIYENLRRENDITRMYYCGLFEQEDNDMKKLIAKVIKSNVIYTRRKNTNPNRRKDYLISQTPAKNISYTPGDDKITCELPFVNPGVLFDFKLADYGIKWAISKKDFPEGEIKNGR